MRKLSLILTTLFMVSTLNMALASCGSDNNTIVPDPLEPVDTTKTEEPDTTEQPDTPAVVEVRCVGGDISMLTKYEEQQALYKDVNGNSISDVLLFLKEQGWNTMRVRLFTDPTQSNDKKSVIQDLEYVKALGKRIKDAGLYFMLDFHYSDTWADPGQQTMPKAWMAINTPPTSYIYTYTKECLQQLVAAGAQPDYIQTGNEITFGMLWDACKVGAKSDWQSYEDKNWDNLATALRNATKACREVCPEAKIIIHTEQAAKNVPLTLDYYRRVKQNNIDYDIIGLSYYPYFHGAISSLEKGIQQLESSFADKKIQIVETGYPSKWGINGSTYDFTNAYPYTHDGQRKLTRDLITMLKKHSNVTGLSWWYPEANAKGATGDLNTGWYNASLFDNETGNALPALYELQSFK